MAITREQQARIDALRQKGIGQAEDRQRRIDQLRNRMGVEKPERKAPAAPGGTDESAHNRFTAVGAPVPDASAIARNAIDRMNAVETGKIDSRYLDEKERDAYDAQIARAEDRLDTLREQLPDDEYSARENAYKIARDARARQTYQRQVQEKRQETQKLSSAQTRRETWDIINKNMDRSYEDNFFGQFGASNKIGALEEEKRIAAGNYTMTGDKAELEKAMAIDQLVKRLQFTNRDTLDDDATLPWISQSLAGYLPQLGNQLKYQAPGAVVGGAIGSLGGAAGVKKGVEYGASVGSGMYSYKTMRGEAFLSLLELGVDEETALAASQDEGVISGLIESADTLADFKLLGVSGLLKTVLKGGAKQIGGAAVSKVAKGLAKYGLKGAAKYVLDVTGEAIQEYTQEGVSIANERRAQTGETGIWDLTRDAAGVVWDDIRGNASEKDSRRMREAAKEGAKIAAMMGGATKLSSTIIENQIARKQGGEFKSQGEESVQSVVQTGLDSPEGTLSRQMAEKIQSKLDRGKEVSDTEIGKLYRENVKEVGDWRADENATQRTTRRAESVSVPSNVEQLGYGEHGKATLESFMETNELTAAEANREFHLPYLQGLSNTERSQVNLTSKLQEEAFNAGKLDRIMTMQSAAKAVQDVRVAEKPGFDGANIPKDVTRAQVKILDKLGKAFGVQIEMADSLKGNAEIRGNKVLISRDFERAIGSDDTKQAVSIVYHAAHEIAMHRLMDLAPEEGRAFLDALTQKTNKGHDGSALTAVQKKQSQYAEQNVSLTAEKAMEEVGANSIIGKYGLYANDKEFAQALRSIMNSKDEKAKAGLARFKELLDEVIAKLRELWNKATGKEKAAIHEAVLEVDELRNTFEEAMAAGVAKAKEKYATGQVGELTTQKNTAQADGEVQYFLNSGFAQEFDEWLKDTPSDRLEFSRGYFHIGTTSDALKSIGVRDGNIYWRKQKLGRIMEDHPELDAKTIKAVPDIIENPVIVMKSLTRDDSIVLFGDVIATNGEKVMAALELTPRAGGGMEAEFSLLTSAYGRSDTSIQNLVSKSEILYLDTNKKRAETWLMPIGVQFPSGQPASGPIGSIRYKNGKVNIRGKTLQELGGKLVKPQFSLKKDSTGKELTKGQQEYFKDSKVVDENGNLRVMYQGGAGDFTVFDRKKSKPSNLYGRGFYFTNSESHAKQYGNARAFYLNIKHPVSTEETTITRAQLRKFLKAVQNNEDDYSFENYGYDATVDGVLKSMYGKSDFAMLYDIDQTAIGNMVETVELFNEVNGTDFDGLILDTETVTFNSEQAKNVDNENPTNDPDVRFSLKDKPVPNYAELTAKPDMVVVDISTPKTHGSFAERRNQILKNAKEVIKKPYLNKDTDTKIFLTKDSYKHAFSNAGEINLNATEHLPELVENAVLTHAEMPTHGNEYANGVYTFFAAVNAKHTLPVKLKVKEITVEGQKLPENIKAYFDDNPEEYAAVYDSVVLEVLEIEESPRGSALPSQPIAVTREHPQELSTIKVADLAGLVKGEARKYLPENSEEPQHSLKGQAGQRAEKTTAENGLEAGGDKAYNGRVDYSLKGNMKYWRPKLNASEWDLLNRRMDAEIESEQNYLDDATKWVYASEKGTTVFALYGIGDGTVPTPLYAVSGKKAISAKQSLDKFMEGFEHGNNRNRAELNRWFKTLPARERSASTRVRNAGKRGAEAGNDSVYFGKRAGDRGRTDGRSAENSEEPQFSLKGSSDLMREEYERLVKQYGAIPAGEKPARKVQVPKKTADGRKVSQTVRTVMEAAVTPDEALPDIEQLVTDGVFSYDVYTDKQAIADAQETVKAQGWAVTLSDWMQSMTRGEVSKKNTAMGWALYNNAVNAGDMETAMAVLSKMVQHQRSAAQALQATRILKSLSPESQLYQIQKSVDGINAELKDKYKDKAPDLTIDPELAKKFMDAKDQTERDQTAKEIYRSVGEQMPSRFIDKWNAWRYLAMLGNPRTHVRNIVGNAGFMPVVMAKDMTAAAIEAAVGRVSGGRLNRTKGMGALSTRSGRELLRAAWDDFGKVKGAVMSDGKYSDFEHSNKDVEDGRTIFRFKPLEAVRKGNSNLLEAEDMWFSRPHYAYALAQYCKAHGITAEQLASGKAIKPARVYAIKEAQKATYRDTNAFSQMVSGWGRTNGSTGAKRVFNTAIEGILPFRKTPANILARGVEYSPIGMIKGLTYDLWRVKQGEISGAEAIDNISAGLTGTGLLALGVYLAAEGLIRGHGGDDEDEKKFEEMMGHQAYSLELPDGTSVTLDWLAPEMLPVFVGVNLWETANGKKEDITLSAILKAIGNVSEPMLEMSVLQSLNDVFNAVGYASSNDMDALPTILASAATSYLTQGIPTLSAQFERSGQDVRMTTYTEKNAFLTSELQRTLGNISAKIPGWDFNQIPYIDAWGRKEYNGNLASRIGSNFLNPAYTDTIRTSEMEKELLRLFDELGEPSVFPDRANKYFTVDGKRKDLTADEYVRYATIKGQESYKLITELVESKAYKKMDDKSKLKAIENAYDMANQNAKAAISSYEPDKWVVKAENADSLGLTTSEYLRLKNEYGAASIGAEGVYEVYEAGGDIETYLRLRDAVSDMKADKDEDGKSIPGSKKEKVLDYMDTMGLTDEEYEIYREALGYSK